MSMSDGDEFDGEELGELTAEELAELEAMDDEDFLDDGDELGELDDDDDDDDIVEVFVEGAEILDDDEVSTGGPETLSVSAIVERIHADVRFIADACEVTLGTAGSLLRVCEFDKNKVMRLWVNDRDYLNERAHVKLARTAKALWSFIHDDTVLRGDDELECPACWCEYPPSEFYALPCKHFLCKPCWARNLHAAISEGPSCLHLLCPKILDTGVRCNVVVTEDAYMQCATESDRTKFEKFLMRQCVADNPRIKWCPAPGCEKAVFVEDYSAAVKIPCSCGIDFCFGCQREFHDTCSCKEVTDWEFKEQDADGGISLWLKVNTKECPGCHKAIEKNQGCNHMTCSQCSYEFCWVCMGEWAPHGSSWYECTRFDQAALDAANAEVADAEAELKEYEHYISRYQNHKVNQKIMKEKLENIDVLEQDYCVVHKAIPAEAEFIRMVFKTLIECYRALKFTYVHACFMKSSQTKEIFAMLQADLEMETNKLAGLIERDTQEIDRLECLAGLDNALNRLRNLQGWEEPEVEAEE